MTFLVVCVSYCFLVLGLGAFAGCVFRRVVACLGVFWRELACLCVLVGLVLAWNEFFGVFLMVCFAFWVWGFLTSCDSLRLPAASPDFIRAFSCSCSLAPFMSNVFFLPFRNLVVCLVFVAKAV